MLESYGLVMGVLVLMTVARFYSENGEPLDGAILFAVMVFFARLYYSHSWLEIGLFTTFSFVYCYFYFRLLCRFRDRIAPWVFNTVHRWHTVGDGAVLYPVYVMLIVVN